MMKKIIAGALGLMITAALCLTAGCTDRGDDYTFITIPKQTETTDTSAYTSASQTERTEQTTETSSTAQSTVHTTDTSEQTTNDDTGLPPAEMPYDYPGDLFSIDFAGELFTVAVSYGYAGESYTDIYRDGEDKVSVAIRTRNRMIETIHDCRIDFMLCENPHDMARAEVIVSGNQIDLFSSALYWNASNASEDWCYNLYGLGLDFAGSWWDREWVNTFTVTANDCKQLHSIIGNFSLNTLLNTQVLFYDRAVLQHTFPDWNMEDIVMSGEWTMDKFAQMMTLGAVDDGNGQYLLEDNDTLGWVREPRTIVQSVFAATGAPFIENSGGAMYFASENMETWQKAAEQTIAFYGEKTSCNLEIKYFSKVMKRHGSVFYSATIAELELINAEQEFGILPYPLYSAEEDRYVSVVDNIASAYSIPTSVSHAKTVATFLEVFTYYSQKKVLPEAISYYGEKYGSEEVVRVIWESRIYDPAYICWQDIYVDTLVNMAQKSENTIHENWAVLAENQFTKLYEDWIDAISDNEY